MSEPKPALATHQIASADTLSATSSAPTSSAVEPIIERGSSIGRYVVLAKIGTGAMGVVVSAHDPELDRKIAIKLLKSRGADQDAARTRLQREAQALAKLDHRNVVGVYDVGMHGDQLFLAMEFIEGQTLGAWMRGTPTPHPWPNVVRVFAEAGCGLAAAHGAGLVHRDFKPDNVMIGKDGRVRVMDFGLARADVESELNVESSYQELRNTDKHALIETLTQTGMLVGTPAYMAPELFDGSPADARSDQFGFCVALYEALHGVRPFSGINLAALIRAVENGQISEPLSRVKVPSWLREIVIRGLAPDPERRWPSMQALLDAIVTVPMKRRRKWSAAVALLGALGAIPALTLLGGGDESESSRDCQEHSERVHEVWNASKSEQLAQMFSTRGELARRSWPFVAAELERWATSWTAIDGELCNRYGHDVAPRLHERQLVCLDRGLDQFELAIAMLESARGEEIEHSFDLLARLPDPARCREASLDEERENVDPEKYDELERDVHRVEFDHELGRIQQTDETTAKLLADTNAPGYEKLHVRLTEIRCELLSKLDRRDEAIDVAFSGLAAAERDGAASLRLRVFLDLVEVHVAIQDLAGAERWLKQAQTLAHEDKTERQLKRDLHYNEGWVLAMGGRLDDGLAAFDRALALTDVETERFLHAQLILDRAQLLGWLGRPTEALEQFELGEREILQRTGSDHPRVLDLRIAKAQILIRLDQWQSARTELLDAAQSLDIVRGPTTTTLAARARAAWLRDRLGDCEGALAEYEPLLPRARQQLPYPSPDLGDVLSRRAEVCDHKTPQAVEFAREALALYREAVGDQHVMVAAARTRVARTLFEAASFAAAREEIEAALSIYTAIAPIGAELVPETRALQMLIRHAQHEAGALDGVEELLGSMSKEHALALRLEALRQ